jgi:perosamine synthetase
MGIIKLPKASISYFKSNLDEIFASGSLAEGPWNKKLSTFCESFCKSKNAIPVVSNGAGMLALLQAYKTLRGRQKTLIQSNTMYGVKTMANAAGVGICGYIDCDPMTLMPSLEHVEKAVNETSEKGSLVVLLSHIGGIINPDIEKIAVYCIEKGVVLLEDCAHSFGATLNDQHSGTFSDGGVYSFYSTKAIPAGEGGIVLTEDDEIGSFIKKYVIYDRFDQQMDVGVNIRPSEIQALLIYSVVKESGEIINNKKQIAKQYIKVCQQLSITYLDQEVGMNKGNYYKFIILSETGDIEKDFPALKTKTSPVYDYCLGSTNIITKNHACLPIWYGQSQGVTEKVIKELRGASVQPDNA